MRQVLKYPGSKWNIARQLAELIPPHHSYVEAFFGSGALLFNKAPSDIETINDLDSDVTNLFRCIQKDSERLARLVMTTPFSREEYDKQFDEIDQTLYASNFQRAAGFLIKCWQGHGFRTNGYKVGWKNDVQGRESMYALWNWYRLPEWIIEITERLRKVQIENRPAMEVIERFNYENVFMYIDPPYVLGTRTEMNEAQLKPCPFCGGKAVLHVGDGVCVICQDCNARTISLVDGNSQGKPCGGAVGRVIEKWNRRVSHEGIYQEAD